MLTGILALAAAAALLWLGWKVRGVLLTPVPRGRSQELWLVLRVSGASPELEATVNGLRWLLADGVLFGGIRILDDGMDPETREIARRLASDGGNISLWTRDWNEIEEWSSPAPSRP